jgi:hypothetical protein
MQANKAQEPLVVMQANALVDPNAMMVELHNALVTDDAVL